MILLHRPVDFERRVDHSATVTNVCYHTRQPGVLNVKLGYLPGYFYVDRAGFGGWAELANHPELLPDLSACTVARRFAALARLIRDRRVTKYPQPATADGPLPHEFLLALTQVQGDDVLRLQYMSTLAMLDIAYDQARALGLPLVVKRHPRDTDARLARGLAHRARQPGFVVRSAAIHDLIAASAGVCVINSGTGFEALLHEKPVFTFGKSDYSRATQTIRGPDCAPQIAATLDAGPDKAAIRHFVVAYLDHYMVHADDPAFCDVMRRRLRTPGAARFYHHPSGVQ